MKLPPAKIDAFIRSPDATVYAVLLYGPDTGLVSQRAEMLAKKVCADLNDPFRAVEISMEKLKDDPALLADEMAAISFGGGRRLIRIRAEGGAGLAPSFKAAFTSATAATARDVCVIITAGDLAATSALRQLFEGMEHIIAIPCYVDDARSLTPIIRDALKKHGLQANGDVIEYLAAHCQGDRLVVLSELSKLALYMGSQTQVMLADVQACVGESTESSLDDICHAVMVGNIAGLQRHYDKALHQGIVPVVMLRSIARSMQRVATILTLCAQGNSVEDAVKSLRPPVFFKQVPQVMQQAQRWRMLGMARVQRAQAKIIDAEIATKTTGNPAELLCHRALLEIAALKPEKHAA